jgi:hypothetical protein
MKKILVACVALAAVFAAAPAQNLPKLSEFLSSCYRDSGACRTKLKDYVNAADSQKIICRPKDASVSDAVSEMLRWLRTEENYPATLKDAPFDDALYEAATKLYPCKAETPPPTPVEPPPAEQPAAPAPQ